ncbi:TPA: hypothetical protein MW242_003449 [Acinetobacter baumannii]|nr:hypothetical protein [Acinetobacter baumannii]
MVDKVPVARHNCDLTEIFDFFQRELEMNYGFVFKHSGKYQFMHIFDDKVPCLTESDNPKKPNSVKPRGMYWIYPNMNTETGELWPVLKGHRFGVTDVEISIAFADHYKNVIKPQRDANPNYKPPSKEDIERRVKEFEAKQELARIQQEKELIAAQIAVRLEWKRASRTIDDSFFDTRSNQLRTFKRDIAKMPYLVDKQLEPYGAKIMQKHNFTEEEAIEAVKRELPESLTNQELLDETVQNVMDYQKHFINFEPELEASKKKGFDLRKSRALQVVPIININNEVINLQRITHHKQNKLNKETNQREEVLYKNKMFFDRAKTKEGLLPISKNPDRGYEAFNGSAKAYLIEEGWATAISTRKAYDAALQMNLLPEGFTEDNTQVIAAYSKSNISAVADLIRKHNPEAKIYLGYDNDAGQTLDAGANPGLQEACHNFSLSGILGNSKHNATRSILPPVFKSKLSASDWDDARLHLGVERLAYELAKEITAADNRTLNKEPEVAYLIGRYNRQREEFAVKSNKADYQTNYGLVIAKADEEFLEMQQIRAKNQAQLKQYQENLSAKRTEAGDFFKDPNKKLKVEKPVYKAPSFDNIFDAPKKATSENASPDTSIQEVKSYLDIIKEIDIDGVKNEVLKVVATQEGHEKIKDGQISFQSSSTKHGASPTQSNTVDMKTETLSINVQNDLTKQQVPLPTVDRNSIPEHNPKLGVDQQSYEKSAIFTAFWLHSAEMHKAKQIIHNAQLNQEDFNQPDVNVIESKLKDSSSTISGKRTYPEMFVISTSDSEYRDSIFKVLEDLEKVHPEWKSLKQFRENLTTKTIAFDQLNIDTMKVQNNVVNLIVGNLAKDSNLEKIQSNLNTILSSSNSSTLDRTEKFKLVNNLKSALSNLGNQLQEPVIFSKINDFFSKFDSRIDDLVKGDGLKLYGIDELQNKRPPPSPPAFEM